MAAGTIQSKENMKLTRKAVVPLLAVAALASACNPFAHKAAPQYPKDPRFSEFVFHSNEEPTVKDQTDSVNLRWPHTEASEAHLTIAYSSQTGFLPDKDPEFWLTAVATVPDETIQLLAEGAATDTPLPGIYPGLYEYVPQECQFTTIDPQFADKTLAPDKSSIPDDFGPMSIEGLAMSKDCHLLVMTALGHS